ncbi:MAG TPA: CBS domain-containing protein [Thermomonas sp.]|jgi:CBS domain-containing protein|nr:CBS domain-containing protein [Thermomonas sp.]
MAQVTSVMTANPSCCREDTPLRDVAQLMIDHDCGMIPVVDADGRPVGAVTDRDIAVRIVARGKDASSSRAGDAMTSPVTTIDSATSLHDATCVMEAEKIRRVIVVDADGKLAGVAAIADLALAGKNEATAAVVREISEPGRA